MDTFPDITLLLSHIQSSTSFSPITYEQAQSALALKDMELRTERDAFLFFSAMNLLNAYVKLPTAHPDFRKNYYFKTIVRDGIEDVLDLQGVKVFSESQVTYIKIMGLQFSFHMIGKSDRINQYRATSRNITQEWHQIRLQPPAGDIFTWALQHCAPCPT